MDGIRVPAGERYEWIEGGNGELGFYAVSDGRGGPYRLRCRPPVLPDHGGVREDHHRRHDLRRRRDARHAQHHRRGARPMSGVDRRHERRRSGAADAPAAALPARDPPRHGRDDAAPPAQPLRHEAAADDRVPRGAAQLLRPLPRQAHPEDARRRHAEVRRLLTCAQQACPAECITIVAGEHPKIAYEKYPVVFDIDMMRCVFCGFCVDACPKDAIWMTRDYEMAFFDARGRGLLDRPAPRDAGGDREVRLRLPSLLSGRRHDAPDRRRDAPGRARQRRARPPPRGGRAPAGPRPRAGPAERAVAGGRPQGVEA